MRLLRDKLRIRGLRGAITLTVAFLFLTAVAVLLLRFVANRQALQNRVAETTQAEVEKMFYAIVPFPGALEKQHNAFHKMQHGVVNSYYESNASFEEAQSYYRGQLAKLGWRYKGKENLTSSEGNQGEVMAFFCKNSISAELYFPGQRKETVGYQYSFGLSWGLYDCK